MPTGTIHGDVIREPEGRQKLALFESLSDWRIAQLAIER
jgi:hypothetical protein